MLAVKSYRNLAERHRIERAKFDEISRRQALRDQNEPFDSFESYARQSSYLPGIAEFLGPLSGRRVLELGCGGGKLAVLLAKSGAHVSAVDISPTSIELARSRAEMNDVADNVAFAVSAAESLPYEDGRFDVVFGSAILHHVNSDQVGPELRRVLRPGGKAAFSEPLGTNPAVRFARAHLPYREKAARGTDRPLERGDLEAWSAWFDEFSWREAHLLGMAERLTGWRWRARPFHRVDAYLLPRFPSLRPLANVVVIYAKKY